MTANKVGRWGQNILLPILGAYSTSHPSPCSHTRPPPSPNQYSSPSVPSTFERKEKRPIVACTGHMLPQRRPGRCLRPLQTVTSALRHPHPDRPRQMGIDRPRAAEAGYTTSRFPHKECLSRVAGVVGRAGSDRCLLVDHFFPKPPIWTADHMGRMQARRSHPLQGGGIWWHVGLGVVTHNYTTLCCVVLGLRCAALSGRRARKRAQPNHRTKTTVIGRAIRTAPRGKSVQAYRFYRFQLPSAYLGVYICTYVW